MGVIFVAISAIFYSTSGMWVALLGDVSCDTVVLSLTRLLIIAVLCFCVCRVRKVSLNVQRSDIWNSILFGCLGQGLTVYLYDLAVSEMSVGPVALCHYTYPILVALASGFINKEKFGFWKASSAVLMLIGLALADGGGAVTVRGVIYALASAVTFGSYVYALDHTDMRRLDPFVLTFYNALFSCVLLALIGFIGRKLSVPSELKICLLMGCAAVTGLLGTVFLAKGVRLIGATKAAFLSVLEPAAAFLWDIFIFHTVLSQIAVIGIFLTFASFFTILLDRSEVPS